MLLIVPTAAHAANELQVDIELYEIDQSRRPALERIVRRALGAVQRDLATDLQGHLHTEFVGSDDAWNERIKANGVHGHLAEPWIAGLALLDADRMLIRLNGPGLLFSSEVVQHELAHIALHALSGRRHLPRWFHEGVAMYVAGEATLRRLAQQPGDFGKLEDLEELDEAFSSHRSRVQRAYNSSGGFIRYLVQQSGNRRSLALLLRRMVLGLSFEPAFTATFGLPPSDLYDNYARYQDSAPSRWAMYASESILWGLISLLSLLAMGRAWAQRPQTEGEILDLEAIAQAGVLAQQASVLWIEGQILRAAEQDEDESRHVSVPSPSEPELGPRPDRGDKPHDVQD